MGFGAVLAHALVRKSVQDPERLLFGGTKPARQALLRAGGFFLFEGVVGGANQGAGFDVLEAHFFAEVFEFGELVGMQEAVDGKMFRRRLQVLAESKDVGLVRCDVAEGLLDLVRFLAEAEHDAGFGREAAALGVAQDAARAVVARLDAHRPLQALHRLDVVVEDVGLGVEHGVDIRGPALEVGDEDLDRGRRVAPANRPDRRALSVSRAVAANEYPYSMMKPSLLPPGA